jgi:hypothetical protein
VRLCLFAFCGGLLLLLSSRPADAAERWEPRLLDPVRTTLKATAREIDSFAGRATGSGTSTVAKAVNAARQVVTPHPRPATGAARPTATPTVKQSAPAVPSPVRRPAPSTRHATAPARTAAKSAGATAKPASRAAKLAVAPVARVAKIATEPVARVAESDLCPPVDNLGNLTSRCARLPLRGAQPGAGSLKGVLSQVVGLSGPVLRPLGPALAPVGSALAPLGTALAPVGSALAPVGSALAPIVGPVGGLLPTVVPGGLLPGPGVAGSGTRVSAGSGVNGPGAFFARFEGTWPASPGSSLMNPVRPAADGASSPAARSIRSWPALTGAVSLPGFPASAELPAGGPDPLSTSSGAGLGLAALAAALVLLGPIGRGLARADGSGVISRSYLPLVSPA